MSRPSPISSWAAANGTSQAMGCAAKMLAAQRIGGDDGGLPNGERCDELPGEPGSEHERLELQRAVEQPEKTQDDLYVAAGDVNAKEERCVQAEAPEPGRTQRPGPGNCGCHSRAAY
jgi:hypothetical protein